MAANRRWPLSLSDGPVGLRPLRVRDGSEWARLRRTNITWLAPWEATRPVDVNPDMSFAHMVRRLRAEARLGRTLPFALTYHDRFVGQLTVGGITWGSLCAGHIGYWIDREYAGRGIMPTAVALATDHALRELGLHRIEICIRPENINSRRVVEKLGFREEGLRPAYLHIDGEWRDHLVYALTADEVGTGVLAHWHQLHAPGATSVPPGDTHS
ncbi:MAG: GNAT family N-acetyltransferase [Sporichthyaceae bacterium]